MHTCLHPSVPSHLNWQRLKPFWHTYQLSVDDGPEIRGGEIADALSQGAKICKSFSKLVALQVARTLDADLSTDNQPSACPEQSGRGLLKRHPTCLRQRKYSQSVKDQVEDVHGTRLHPAL